MQLEQEVNYNLSIKDKSSTNKNRENYSTFVEQFLEEPIIEERYSPIRAMGSWVIPTFCTFKFIPLVDDVDDL